MDIQNIDIKKLVVSDLNVRKQINGEEDEASITDLSNDIKVNDLLLLNNNPCKITKKIMGSGPFIELEGIDIFTDKKYSQITPL